MDPFDAPAAAERPEQIPHAPVVRHHQPLSQRGVVLRVAHARERTVASRRRKQQAALPELERPHPLHERFLEGAADRHRLAHRFHLRGERPIGLRKLLEVPARNLDHDVVDRRLEGGWRDARDVVGDLVEVIAERQLRGDLRDWKPGGLRRERRRARDARVHFDHDHPPVGRIDGELDVRPAGFDADLADDPPRRVAHALVFLVAQRQDRRHGDAVARVDAHRIDVLDRADHDEIVGDVAHHLELELFPADHRFLDQHFVDRAELEAALGEVAELFDVVGDAATDAAQRERRPDHDREPERVRQLHRFGRITRQAALRDVEADRPHRVLEQLAVFGNLDRFDRGADQPDVVLRQRAGVGEIHGQIEGGLAADGRQNRVRPLALDDRGEKFRRQRLHVGAIRQLRVGHDRGWIAVHQDDLEALGAQRLARLGARVIELAGLPDHDRTGAKDEHPAKVGSLRHPS